MLMGGTSMPREQNRTEQRYPQNRNSTAHLAGAQDADPGWLSSGAGQSVPFVHRVSDAGTRAHSNAAKRGGPALLGGKGVPMFGNVGRSPSSS
jgi:hypothetical protein